MIFIGMIAVFMIGIIVGHVTAWRTQDVEDLDGTP